MKPIRVLLADDHVLLREGLAGIIDAQPDFDVVGEAGDGLEAVVKASELDPDLILMDVTMPGCSGLEATRQIKQELSDVTVVMLTVHAEEEKLFDAIKYGAQGYLLKNMKSEQMLASLRGAMRGEAAITPTLAGAMLEEFRRLSTRASRIPDEEIVALTSREQEVLSLAAEGHTDQEIADRLCISINTVKTHMRNILAKLHLSSRHEAALYARREGLIPPPGTV